MAVNFTSLGGETHFGEPRVIRYDLEIDSGERSKDSRIDGRARRGTCGSNHDLAMPEIGKSFEVRAPERAG